MDRELLKQLSELQALAPPPPDLEILVLLQNVNAKTNTATATTLLTAAAVGSRHTDILTEDINA